MYESDLVCSLRVFLMILLAYIVWIFGYFVWRVLRFTAVQPHSAKRSATHPPSPVHFGNIGGHLVHILYHHSLPPYSVTSPKSPLYSSICLSIEWEYTKYYLKYPLLSQSLRLLMLELSTMWANGPNICSSLRPIHLYTHHVCHTHPNPHPQAVNIADLRKIAKWRAHKMVFDYLDAGWVSHPYITLIISSSIASNCIKIVSSDRYIHTRNLHTITHKI